MGLFRKQNYIKDKKGKWILVKDEIENAPHDIGRWLQSKELERKSDLHERVFLNYQSTKGGLNKKVSKVSSYFGKNEKTVRTLITTSNKLPRKYHK